MNSTKTATAYPAFYSSTWTPFYSHPCSQGLKQPFKPPPELMSYKQQCRIEGNELYTKFRIVRDVMVHGMSRSSVAQKFHMHRNSVGNILCDFREKVSTDDQVKALENRKKPFSKIEVGLLLAPLKNKVPIPLSNSRSATKEQADAVVEIFNERKVRVGAKRLKMFLKRRSASVNPKTPIPPEIQKEIDLLGDLSYSQIRGVYKRNGLRVQKVKTRNKQHTPLYDYKSLACFERLHYDTKTIPDQKALPPHIYEKFKHQKDLPTIEWNIIDVKSRFRFIAYSYSRTSDFGLQFLLFVISFIRAQNLISTDLEIVIGTDNGSEFFSGSVRKKQEWNHILQQLNANIYSYNPGHDVRKNLIERSHRTDDEEFFVPRGDFISNKADFQAEASAYSHYFNFQRPHSGIEMHNMTPFEKAQNSDVPFSTKLALFPTMILEDVINDLRIASEPIRASAFLLHQSSPFSQKFIADFKDIFKNSFSLFFQESAQKVLTQYLLGFS